jgi:hypothetical protein
VKSALDDLLAAITDAETGQRGFLITGDPQYLEPYERGTARGTPDWSTIPAPYDDGATRHLIGGVVPSVPLRATTGEVVDLFSLRGRTIVYAAARQQPARRCQKDTVGPR